MQLVQWYTTGSLKKKKPKRKRLTTDSLLNSIYNSLFYLSFWACREEEKREIVDEGTQARGRENVEPTSCCDPLSSQIV